MTSYAGGKKLLNKKIYHIGITFNSLYRLNGSTITKGDTKINCCPYCYVISLHVE